MSGPLQGFKTNIYIEHSSIEQKEDIQIFEMNMPFISSEGKMHIHEWRCIFHEW